VERSTISIVPRQAPLEAAPALARGDTSRSTTPLYIVCSPRRGVGKTLLARLLTEFHLIDGRPVAAFDLADEEPQLADYLPRCTTIADIGDTLGQMALFDRLIADDHATKIVDLSHRSFKEFFLVVQKIGFFEEARRRSVEPLIFYVIDPSPKSASGYAILRRWFAEASLLPVRNQIVAKGIPHYDAFPNASASFVSLEIPVLDHSPRALVDQQMFSFADFWRTTPVHLPVHVDDELRGWMKRIFRQFREVELRLMCEEILSALE
jgi:hypothetical protein